MKEIMLLFALGLLAVLLLILSARHDSNNDKGMKA